MIRHICTAALALVLGACGTKKGPVGWEIVKPHNVPVKDFCNFVLPDGDYRCTPVAAPAYRLRVYYDDGSAAKELCADGSRMWPSRQNGDLTWQCYYEDAPQPQIVRDAAGMPCAWFYSTSGPIRLCEPKEDIK
jgi:hypothetical protein